MQILCINVSKVSETSQQFTETLFKVSLRHDTLGNSPDHLGGQLITIRPTIPLLFIPGAFNHAKKIKLNQIESNFKVNFVLFGTVFAN